MQIDPSRGRYFQGHKPGDEGARGEIQGRRSRPTDAHFLMFLHMNTTLLKQVNQNKTNILNN